MAVSSGGWNLLVPSRRLGGLCLRGAHWGSISVFEVAEKSLAMMRTAFFQ